MEEIWNRIFDPSRMQKIAQLGTLMFLLFSKYYCTGRSQIR